MPKLFDGRTFIDFFKLDENNETLNLSSEAIDMWLKSNQFGFTEDLCKWAKEKYPNAPHLYHCCFAGLIAYFATGVYGGYGTERVQKERFAENKAYEFFTCLHEMLSPEQMTIALIYFTISHLLQESPMDAETEAKIKEAIRVLKNSKSSFTSTQVANARRILEGI